MYVCNTVEDMHVFSNRGWLEFIEGCGFDGCDSFCCEWFWTWHVLLEDGIVNLKHVGVEVTLMSHVYLKCVYCHMYIVSVFTVTCIL